VVKGAIMVGSACDCVSTNVSNTILKVLFLVVPDVLDD
jgi:hypothetical protein